MEYYLSGVFITALVLCYALYKLDLFKVTNKCENLSLSRGTFKETDIIPCNCLDVNHCDRLCTGKQNFMKDNCFHTYRTTRVICQSGTCETIAEFCEFCNKQLSEPKTDCR